MLKMCIYSEVCTHPHNPNRRQVLLLARPAQQETLRPPLHQHRPQPRPKYALFFSIQVWMPSCMHVCLHLQAVKIGGKKFIDVAPKATYAASTTRTERPVTNVIVPYVRNRLSLFASL